MTKILVTGAAGFIGYHLCAQLCQRGDSVLGLDSINDYYDVSLKEARLARLQEYENFSFIKANLADRDAMEQAFADFKPQRVVNLAAQAGVRYSIDNPHAYVESNLIGFINILENCRHHNVEHLVFASSSSVYGANTKLPFSVQDTVDHPVSLYAASKKSNELMAHSYAHLYNLPCTGLRFFTVYGPWGRPDMAMYKFTDAIFAGRPIDIYNNGDMQRDFTYIDDIIEGVMRVTDLTPSGNPAWDSDNPDPATSKAPYVLYNIGNNSPENLLDMIGILEDEIGIKARKNMMPMQAGDVHATYANVDALVQDTGFKPGTPLRTGIRNFVQWFREYHGNLDNTTGDVSRSALK